MLGPGDTAVPQTDLPGIRITWNVTQNISCPGHSPGSESLRTTALMEPGLPEVPF